MPRDAAVQDDPIVKLEPRPTPERRRVTRGELVAVVRVDVSKELLAGRRSAFGVAVEDRVHLGCPGRLVVLGIPRPGADSSDPLRVVQRQPLLLELNICSSVSRRSRRRLARVTAKATIAKISTARATMPIPMRDGGLDVAATTDFHRGGIALVRGLERGGRVAARFGDGDRQRPHPVPADVRHGEERQPVPALRVSRLAGDDRLCLRDIADIASARSSKRPETAPTSRLNFVERRRVAGLQELSQSVAAIKPDGEQPLRVLDPIKAPLLGRFLDRRRREHGRRDENDRQRHEPRVAQPARRLPREHPGVVIGTKPKSLSQSRYQRLAPPPASPPRRPGRDVRR